MTLFEIIGLIYLLLINSYGFIIFAWDKRRARLNQSRVSESHLLLTAFLGGGIGAYMAMYTYHHKTRKLRFKIGIPLMILLWLITIAVGT